jgi:hypothetical protein
MTGLGGAHRGTRILGAEQGKDPGDLAYRTDQAVPFQCRIST